MSKVTEMRIGGVPLGAFRLKMFNMFEPRDMTEYAELRTSASNAASGIKIEQIKEVSRKTVVREGGEEGIVTTTEDIFLVVQYWEKKIASDKEDTNEDFEDEKNRLRQVSLA